MKSGDRYLVVGAILCAGVLGSGVTAAGQSSSAGPSASGAGQAATADTRTEKQKALAQEADKLFDMATELKAQVDKTNKYILSMTVVRKAEEIEVLAKGIKEQAKH